MGNAKTAKPLPEERETEYIEMCGGIQPVILPETEEKEEEEVCTERS